MQDNQQAGQNPTDSAAKANPNFWKNLRAMPGSGGIDALIPKFEECAEETWLYFDTIMRWAVSKQGDPRLAATLRMCIKCNFMFRTDPESDYITQEDGKTEHTKTLFALKDFWGSPKPHSLNELKRERFLQLHEDYRARGILEDDPYEIIRQINGHAPPPPPLLPKLVPLPNRLFGKPHICKVLLEYVEQARQAAQQRKLKQQPTAYNPKPQQVHSMDQSSDISRTIEFLQSALAKQTASKINLVRLELLATAIAKATSSISLAEGSNSDSMYMIKPKRGSATLQDEVSSAYDVHSQALKTALGEFKLDARDLRPHLLAILAPELACNPSTALISANLAMIAHKLPRPLLQWLKGTGVPISDCFPKSVRIDPPVAPLVAVDRADHTNTLPRLDEPACALIDPTSPDWPVGVSSAFDSIKKSEKYPNRADRKRIRKLTTRKSPAIVLLAQGPLSPRPKTDLTEAGSPPKPSPTHRSAIRPE